MKNVTNKLIYSSSVLIVVASFWFSMKSAHDYRARELATITTQQMKSHQRKTQILNPQNRKSFALFGKVLKKQKQGFSQQKVAPTQPLLLENQRN